MPISIKALCPPDVKKFTAPSPKEIPAFVSEVPRTAPADKIGSVTPMVYVEKKMTVNMGNYESTSITVGITAPIVTTVENALASMIDTIDDTISTEILKLSPPEESAHRALITAR